MNRRNTSSQETPFQRYDLRTRRLRLMTNIMEDYQDNVRRMIRLIGCELGISNHVFPHSDRGVNVDEWMNRVSQVSTDMYSSDAPRNERRHENAPYSFNEMPPRGFLYAAELSGVEVNSGITREQIDASTELVQYDASMNESRCPISWDTFTVGQNVLQIRSCGHIFGEDALRQWFTNHNVCPVCRTVVGRRGSLSERFAGLTSRGSAVDSSGNSSSILTQIVSSLVSSLNGASIGTNQIYESEFEFNVNDLMDAYTQLNNASSNARGI